MTKEELGTLILNSERQLYSTAKTILINDQDCADAIQKTIVKAFSKIGTLRNDKYAKTWLIRILINECYTLLRESSKLVSLEGMSEMTEIETDQKTDYSDLYRAVKSLKEELRMPVILYYIEDFNIKEIAQILEITEGAVQKRLASTEQVLECRGAVLNTSDASLTYQGEKLELTKNEYRILQTLYENLGKVVSRDTLMQRLWETDCFVDENTLTVNVTRLRRKLDGIGLQNFIVTRKGMGYLLVEE